MSRYRSALRMVPIKDPFKLKRLLKRYPMLRASSSRRARVRLWLRYKVLGAPGKRASAPYGEFRTRLLRRKSQQTCGD